MERLLQDHDIRYIKENGANSDFRKMAITPVSVKVVARNESWIVDSDSVTNSNVDKIYNWNL